MKEFFDGKEKRTEKAFAVLLVMAGILSLCIAFITK